MTTDLDAVRFLMDGAGDPDDEFVARARARLEQAIESTPLAHPRIAVPAHRPRRRKLFWVSLCGCRCPRCRRRRVRARGSSEDVEDRERCYGASPCSAASSRQPDNDDPCWPIPVHRNAERHAAGEERSRTANAAERPTVDRSEADRTGEQSERAWSRSDVPLVRGS